MAMAALRHATRRLACQRPPAIHRAAVAEQPRRLLNGGLSAGRNFSLAEEQRWMLPRLLHGGSPAVGRIYSRQFSSFHLQPNPSTFMEKAKQVYKLCDRTTELIRRISFIFFKLTLIGAVVLDCCRSQYLLLIARVMMGLEPQEWFLTGDKEGECQALGEGKCHQQHKREKTE